MSENLDNESLNTIPVEEIHAIKLKGYIAENLSTVIPDDRILEVLNLFDEIGANRLVQEYEIGGQLLIDWIHETRVSVTDKQYEIELERRRVVYAGDVFREWVFYQRGEKMSKVEAMKKLRRLSYRIVDPGVLTALRGICEYYKKEDIYVSWAEVTTIFNRDFRDPDSQFTTDQVRKICNRNDIEKPLLREFDANRQMWTKGDYDMLLALCNADRYYTNADIADRLGKSESAVRHAISRDKDINKPKGPIDVGDRFRRLGELLRIAEAEGDIFLSPGEIAIRLDVSPEELSSKNLSDPGLYIQGVLADNRLKRLDDANPRKELLEIKRPDVFMIQNVIRRINNQWFGFNGKNHIIIERHYSEAATNEANVNWDDLINELGYHDIDQNERNAKRQQIIQYHKNLITKPMFPYEAQDLVQEMIKVGKRLKSAGYDIRNV